MAYRARPGSTSPAQTPAPGSAEDRVANPVAIGKRKLATPSPSTSSGDEARSAVTASRWKFVVLAEIGNFAMLRRLLGRARADTLVVDLAERIAASRPSARMSAVGRAIVEIEFDGADRAELDGALDCLVAAFERPFDFDGEELRLEMLFGAAAATALHCDDVRLDEEAEEALVEARLGRRSVTREVRALPPQMDVATLARDLSRAVARGEMFLQYQPKVHLRRQKVTSAEALVRWNHPTRGLIQPNDFIALAEEVREIAGITLWSLRQVIADQRTLSARDQDLRLYVNISGQLLADDPFVSRVCEIVVKSGAKLGFEITETSVIRDPAIAIANLQRFADIGVTIAIDDYGSGLSSLAYLKQLPASELKIDKLFVTQLTSSNRDPLIVRSTIDLAHALEMEVVAEGVETQAALALLSVMGCDLVQGFLISRPIGLDALSEFLVEQNYLNATVDPKASFNNLAAIWKRG